MRIKGVPVVFWTAIVLLRPHLMLQANMDMFVKRHGCIRRYEATSQMILYGLLVSFVIRAFLGTLCHYISIWFIVAGRYEALGIYTFRDKELGPH